jgi:hypothetical protein
LPFALAALAFGLLASPAGAEPSPVAGGPATSVTGELIVAVADDFPGRRAQRIYLLSDRDSGRTYQLEMPRAPRATGRSGVTVTLRGVVRGGRLLLDEGSVQLLEASAATQPSVDTMTASGTVEQAARSTQDRQALVMVARFNDVSVSCSSGDLDLALFSDPGNRSVDALYRETSLGRIGFGGTVTAPLAVDDTATGKCDIGGWTTALDAAARAAGLDPSRYDHNVYVLPRESSCSVGVGSVGGDPGRVWIERCDLMDAFAHELGHNLGMNHASTPTDAYGDTSDIMGYAGVGLRQIDAPHQEQMGWRSARQIVTLTSGGTYDIAPLELSDTQALAPQILKIAKPDTGEYYYLSYRRPLGFDGIINSTYFRLNVHRYAGGTARTFLLGLYDPGQSFVDSVNGITVTAVSQTADYLTVQVQLGAGCMPAAPTVTLSPADQNGAAGETRNYTVAVSNRDSQGCTASTFSLSGSIPSGWSGALAAGSITLAPGATAQTTLAVTSPASAAADIYTVSAQAVDGTATAHAASASGTYAVVPASTDTETPSPPSGLAASVNNAKRRIGLAWFAATDNVGIAGYRVYRDGGLVGSPSGTSFADGSVTDALPHTYFVTAVDAAGNESAASNSVTAALSGKGNGRK